MDEKRERLVAEAKRVVSHGERKKKRGRGPSMQFDGIRNPRKALSTARLALACYEMMSELTAIGERKAFVLALAELYPHISLSYDEVENLQDPSLPHDYRYKNEEEGIEVIGSVSLDDSYPSHESTGFVCFKMVREGFSPEYPYSQHYIYDIAEEYMAMLDV